MGSSLFLVPSSNSFHKRTDKPRPRSVHTQISTGSTAITTITTTRGPATTSHSSTTTKTKHSLLHNRPPPQHRTRPTSQKPNHGNDDLTSIWSGSPIPPSQQNSFLKRLLLCEKVLSADRPQSRSGPGSRRSPSIPSPSTPTHLKPLILSERYGLSTPTPTPPSTASPGSDPNTMQMQPDLMTAAKMAGSKIGQPGGRIQVKKQSKAELRKSPMGVASSIPSTLPFENVSLSDVGGKAAEEPKQSR